MNKPTFSLTAKDKKSLSFLLVMLAILIVTLSCSLPFKIVWTGGDDVDQPSAEQTDSNESNQDLITPDKDTDDKQVTEEVHTGTPSPTPSPTLSPTVQLTPTLGQIFGTVKKNTNCRSGPKDNYDLVHVLKKGDTLTILGKNEEDTFWYVKWQNGEVVECWMWNEYVSSDGASEHLPILTPPPSPVPVLAFVLSYKNTNGETTVNVYLRNSGNIPLASYSATFKDTVTGEVLTKLSNSFGSMAGVSAGNITTISSPGFSASTIGHNMMVSIKACTQDNQSGKCSTISTTFESK